MKIHKFTKAFIITALVFSVGFGLSVLTKNTARAEGSVPSSPLSTLIPIAPPTSPVPPFTAEMQLPPIIEGPSGLSAPATGVIPDETLSAVNFAHTANVAYSTTWQPTTINNDANGDKDWNYATEFGFENADKSGSGDCGSYSGFPCGLAYYGLQPNSTNGTSQAIFSVFGFQDPSLGSGCTDFPPSSNFDGFTGLSGTRCLVNFAVTPGDSYTEQILVYGSSGSNFNWVAAFTDNTTHASTAIVIHVPQTWGILDSFEQSFSEYYDTNATYPVCQTSTLSDTTFGNYQAEFLNGTWFYLNAVNNFVNPNGQCLANSKVTPTSFVTYEHIIGTP